MKQTKGAITIENIAEHLFKLEADAREAMNHIEKENALLTSRQKENITLKKAEIEETCEETIRNLIIECDNHTAERIDQIQEEYLKKTSDFKKDFNSQKDALRGKIFHDVLDS